MVSGLSPGDVAMFNLDSITLKRIENGMLEYVNEVDGVLVETQKDDFDASEYDELSEPVIDDVKPARKRAPKKVDDDNADAAGDHGDS